MNANVNVDKEEKSSTDPPPQDAASETPVEEEEEREEDWKIQRDAFKTKADQAFRMKAYKTAIAEYSSAIALDPDFVVLYSNRSAAYLSNSEISKALKDAQKCVELDKSFVKGHSRLAAALLALRRYPQALESYENVLMMDPQNAAAKLGKARCEEELKRIEKVQQEHEKEQEGEPQQSTQNDISESETATGDKAEAIEEDGEEDDLLDDFFNEVEETVAKKKEEKAAAITDASATNAIRNDREVLGTTEQQMDRLLQEHYEWRNLNPYFVLQLPTTATDDDISRRYKALSLLLHPDKNHAKLSEKDRERAQLAYDQVQAAKQMLSEDTKKRHVISLIGEGMKNGEHKWAREQQQKGSKGDSLESCQEKEVMRIFAQVEQKRRDVEERERKYEQRQQQQEDDQLKKERGERKFDKQWKEEGRVDKRVGNWRDFSQNKKPKA